MEQLLLSDPTMPAAAADLQTLLGLGHQAQQRGEHAAALAQFAAAARQHPANPWPLLHAGNALRQLGRMAEAQAGFLACLEAAANDAPARLQALLGLGHCAQQLGDNNAALEHFEAAAAVDPADPWPALYRGHTLRALGRDEAAQAAYRQALAGDGPARLHAWLGLGHAAQQAGDHAGALAQFQAAADASPADPWPHFYAGSALRQLGRGPDAEAAYRRTLATAPRHYHATLGLGLLARARGERAAATALFETATTIEPANPAAWLELAADLRDQGDFAAALDALTRLAELQPAQPDIWIDMALNQRRLGQPAAATALLERALALVPDHARALESLAELARLARDFEGALTLLRRAVAAHPANPWPRIGLAQTLAELGRLSEALGVLDEAETRAAGADTAHVAIAGKRLELLRRAGHWTRARALARQAARDWPANFALWEQRCLTELLAGDADSVAACLDTAPASTAQQRARLHQFRGQAAEALWRHEDAIAHYAQALEIAPNDGWVHQNMARVRLLRLDLAQSRAHLAAMVGLDTDFVVRHSRFARVSWTHYGELLNEFELDRDALAALTAVRDLPPGARVAAVLPLVRRFPDCTATAICLLIALRQAGALASPAPAPGVSPIPRNIMQYWDRDGPPADVQTLMRTWQEWHPDHACHLFDDAAARTFLAETYRSDVLAAYRRAKQPAQKADIFRLAWLFAHGGLYADCDDRCHAPLATIIPPHATLALYQEDLGTLGNNFIAAVPQHKVIGRALDEAVASVAFGDGDMLWLGTGPGLLSRAFAQTLATSRLSWPGWLRHAAVLDRSELARAVAIHCFVGYKLTERHWSETARRDGRALPLQRLSNRRSRHSPRSTRQAIPQPGPPWPGSTDRY
jgi:tetratricopeptide (TPR) repeat protein